MKSELFKQNTFTIFMYLGFIEPIRRMPRSRPVRFGPTPQVVELRRVNLDIALLRTFAAVVEMGSVARAADAVARSQPAVSLQLRRLEEAVGQSLFLKTGRKLAMTEAGAILLGYAQRMLELNDETMSAVSLLGISGSIRLGISQDFAEGFLTNILGRFASAHPSVIVEVRADRNAVLQDQLSRKRLDLALMFGEEHGKNVSCLGQVPMVWIGSSRSVKPQAKPVSLVVFEPPCVFRQAAVQALEAAGKRWRVAFSSPNLASQWAAVEAGLGVSVRTPVGMRSSHRILGRRDGFPPLQSIGLCLHLSEDRNEEPVRLLRSILVDTVRQAIAPSAFAIPA